MKKSEAGCESEEEEVDREKKWWFWMKALERKLEGRGL